MGIFSKRSVAVDHGSCKDNQVDPGRKPRVLIGVPGFAGVQPEAQENFFELAYHCGRYAMDYDFCLKILTKREQFRARNSLVDLAIMNDCQFLLMLDDDMMVPPNLFLKLVAHDKDIIGALYYQRGGAFHPVLMRQKSVKDGFRSIEFLNHFDHALVKPGLHPVDVIGGGCLLMKVDVFRSLQQPYFWIDGIVGTDVHLCTRLKDAGIQPYADTSIELGHLGEKQIVTSRTVPRYNKAVGLVNEQLWLDLLEYYQAADDDELQSRMIRSSEGNIREEKWGEYREHWDDIRSFYTVDAEWQVLNLARYNLEFDEARQWALTEIDRAVPEGGTLIDYGAGLGYCTIPLAQKGYALHALDLAGAPTLKFLDWRIAKHHLPVQVHRFRTEVPEALPGVQADGCLLISVIDHLPDPWGALKWISAHVKPGGFLLCDTWRQIKMADEPQHLCRFNAHTFVKDLRKFGWRDVPENPFLFIKE
jgi:2-polyprenyl-3-methyl-5-hydroxy-6-metoxy-1,4-benzoquinol methylase